MFSCKMCLHVLRKWQARRQISLHRDNKAVLYCIAIMIKKKIYVYIKLSIVDPVWNTKVVVVALRNGHGHTECIHLAGPISL